MGNKSQILQRTAVGLALGIILLGALFLLLDILDINENYRLSWSIPVFNTIFISAINLIALIFATRNVFKSGSLVMLALGGGTLALGASVFLYSWLPVNDLEIRMMLYDIGVLFSSVLHLSMTIITAARPGLVFRESGSRAVITVSMYIGILLILGVITWLGYRGILTYSTKIITEYLTSRDVIQGLGAVFCVISAIVYLIRYSRQRRGMYFWYSLGLVMLAAGFFFVLRGFLASRVAWTGRAALYLGSIYFVIATWMGIAETKEPGTG